ncbi:hypothetical protein PPTG_06635 [Phytophthora nicotianae INRA-310]|uniref:Uncharacterized protein n=1 Tax=Phytophthora nicotianae (strain INRA-310) TaxID=761204 RepID=W2QS94_PHYN3|nr:hypothetical protein PPTG_06635 [Phytophthora nicotianae INRA-310]ETN15359.1 hypothetical protein PPTG_06635 [Phytophthora nicotianae INRA-310]
MLDFAGRILIRGKAHAETSTTTPHEALEGCLPLLQSNSPVWLVYSELGDCQKPLMHYQYSLGGDGVSMANEATRPGTPGPALTGAQEGKSTVCCVSDSAQRQNEGRHLQDNSEQHRLQLVVQGIVKYTVGKRNSSGKMLDVFAANGATFDAIMHKLWGKFKCHINRQAVKDGDAWTCVESSESTWNKVMGFKVNGRIIPTSKSEKAWNRWVASLRGDTATLMIYTYGLSISNARILEEFKGAYIRPEHTDRSELLQRRRFLRWWNDFVKFGEEGFKVVPQHGEYPPTARILPMLQAASARVEQHLADLTKSADLALDIVDASLKDNKQLHHHWEMFGLSLSNQKEALEARKRTLEGIRANIPLPPLSTVTDPLASMENMEDTEHQE